MNKPKVTVLMPAYNAEKYIRESIESILNQTYSDFILLIIDDGSIDMTENIVKSYNDPRIIFLKNEQN
ncbi:MAG: glycosyltransferase family 2 protein, partial [Bacteroidia bacterium]